MNRSTLIAATLGLGLAAPAAAATYSASLDQPATGRFIDRDISWRCGGATCTGATSESRPLVLCQGLAKQAGRIGSFSVNGRAFAADQLERCNAAAKTARPAELAKR